MCTARGIRRQYEPETMRLSMAVVHDDLSVVGQMFKVRECYAVFRAAPVE